MKWNYAMTLLVCLLFARVSLGVELGDLARLAQFEGKGYVKERAKLVSTDTQWTDVADAKHKLLSEILNGRRSNGTLFSAIDEIIRRSRVLRSKMTEIEKAYLTRERRLQLAYDLSKKRRKNAASLNLAIAELLWKTAEDDYERLCAVRALSLHSRPIVGIFEITHNVLQETKNNALAYELLGTLFRYVVSYGKGDKKMFMEDIALVSLRFEKELSIQERCLKFLNRVDPKDTQHSRDVINERIKALREKARLKKLADEIEIQNEAVVVGKDVDVKINP
jgi:hypothetical protein